MLGPTATGAAPFLAQTNPAPFAGQATYVPNAPLETSEPIKGAPQGKSIFQKMGDLCPYFSPDEGFGVDEHALPKGATITQAHMLQRHGARYPSSSEGHDTWAAGINNATRAGTVFQGELAFLNDWTYKLGKEMLVPRGRQELFDSGILNYYNYGHLHDKSTENKLVIRTTLQSRMLESAENFLAGFYGLEWRNYANILASIDPATTGDIACKNEATTMMANLAEPMGTWAAIYLKDKTAELRKLTGNYEWTVSDTSHAQAMCPYETISLGYSDFCQLFSYEDWENYDYNMDLMFAGLSGFLSPTGRAQGVAWVEEFIARVEGHYPDAAAAANTGLNLTVDANPTTFPLNQSLYFEFTHDANIISVLTAFGLTQFADYLPANARLAKQQFQTSKLVPFAGRLNIELITAPHKVVTKRSARGGDDANYVSGTAATRYVHFVQNQRTLPLHLSIPACEERDDGWCELSAFLEAQKANVVRAQYDYTCNGNWTLGAWGSVRDGVPASAK